MVTKPTWTIHQGDALTVLRTLPSGSVHCVVTSPPYWGLRNYGVEGQLGLERTPEEYVARLAEIFRDLKRVLRKDGTLWLNLGDSYSGSNGNGNQPQTRVNLTAEYFTPFQNVTGRVAGLKPKDLVGIPWMVAFALRADGWYLRSDIIWSKPNPMPESVTDRPTKSHEYLFLLTKSERYYFDQEAVRELATSTDDSLRDRDNTKLNNTPGRTRMGGLTTNGYHVRNVRSVWNIATEPFSEAHFATFPKRLVRRCLLAGISEKGICADCSAPWQRIIEKDVQRSEVEPTTVKGTARQNGSGQYRPNSKETGGVAGLTTNRSIGWEPSCKCNAPTVPATVLDPFSGSGTTGVVATKMGYNYIGIELNPEYIAMSERRLETVTQQHGVFV